MKWYKNKWGWVGAIAWVIIAYSSYMASWCDSCTRTAFQDFLFYITLFPIWIARELARYSNTAIIISLISIPLIGFIIGLILEKIWRKLK